MVLRNIVKIDEEKCAACGQCVEACAEGAIELVDGKAKLVSEVYCDGLGVCIGHCPQDAITVEKRESEVFDEEATKKHLAGQQETSPQAGFVCPGTMAKSLRETGQATGPSASKVRSQLAHWPIQLKLVPPNAPYFADADMLLVADCVPFAMGDFHNKFLKDRNIAIGCPKLDAPQFYVEKLAQILKTNRLRSLTVVHREVPCCFGLTEIAQRAIAAADVELAFEDVTVALDGSVAKTVTVNI